MGKKLTKAIVSAGLLYSAKVLAQGEALEPAGSLPEGLTEFGVLSDSETWGKLLSVQRRENDAYVILNERLGVKTKRRYNRNFGLEDVMVFVQDMDPVEKRKDPEKKDFIYIKPPVLTSEVKLPDWIADGPFRAYLLSGRGQISTRYPNNVYRLDEHYELPQPAGVLQLGAGGGTAVKPAGSTSVDAKKAAGSASGTEPKNKADVPAEGVRRSRVENIGKSTPVATAPRRESAVRKLFKNLEGALRLEGSFAHSAVASQNADTEMSGTAGGIGFALAYHVRAWDLGLFGDFHRRGFSTENTYGVVLGDGNHSTDFAAGATAGFASQSGRRIDLISKLYFGFLGHRGRNDFERLRFEESGNGLVLDGNVVLPRLFKKNKFYWGIRDEFSLEALSLRQRENSSNFESEYGWKTRGTNKLLTTLAFGRADLEFGWQLDSVYNLKPVSNNPFNVSENSVAVETKGNLYGNQAVFGATYKYFGLNATLPLAGDVNRKGVGLRFGSFNGEIDLNYEDVEANSIRDRRFIVSLTLKNAYLLPRQRRVYPGLR